MLNATNVLQYLAMLAAFATTCQASFNFNQTDPETNKQAGLDFFNTNTIAFTHLPAVCRAAFYNTIDCDIQLLSLNPISKSFNYRIRNSDYQDTCTDTCRDSVANWAVNLTNTCGSSISNSNILFSQTTRNGTNVNGTAQASTFTPDLAFRVVYGFACFTDPRNDNDFCGTDYPKFAAELPGILYGLSQSSGKAGNTSKLCGEDCLLQYLYTLESSPLSLVAELNITKVPTVEGLCPGFNASSFPLLSSASVIAANTSANNSSNKTSFAIGMQTTGSTLSLVMGTALISALVIVLPW